MKYLVFETKKEASKEAYKILKSLINENSTLGLATGSTPTDLYEEMIKDHKEGNFSYKNIKSYNLNLFDHIDIDKSNTHIPEASAENLNQALENYQNELNNTTIDVQILGLGGNGHIGFNEPGTPFNSGVHVIDLKEETIKANSRFFNNDVNLVPKQAVTMGINDIMKAKHIILLAFGKEKQAAIKNLIDSDIVDESIPCTVLKKHPSVYVLVDKEADFRN